MSSTNEEESKFINDLCNQLNVTYDNIYERLTADCVAGKFDSPLCEGLKAVFRYDCLCDDSHRVPSSNNYIHTKLFAHLIAGRRGIEELTRECNL